MEVSESQGNGAMNFNKNGGTWESVEYMKV